MIGSPNFGNNSSKPYVELYETWNLETKLYSNKEEAEWAWNSLNGSVLINSIGGDILKWIKHPLVGDLYLRVKNLGSIRKTVICWVGFNTTFLGDETRFGINDLDPDSIWKDSWYPMYL